MSPATPTPGDRDQIAGEYVMGLLGEEEGARLEAAARNDTALAAAIAHWRERFSGLDAVADRLDPGPLLWERIETALARPAPAVAPAADESSGWWQSLAFWRVVALGGSAAAILFAGIITLQLVQRPGMPVAVAVLEAEDSTPGAIVEAFADGSVILRPLEAIPVPAGRALQVWTLWDREVGPVSLGVLDRAQRIRLPGGKQPRPRNEQLYEITLEPETGSPTGRPTGPILFKGLASEPL